MFYDPRATSTRRVRVETIPPMASRATNREDQRLAEVVRSRRALEQRAERQAAEQVDVDASAAQRRNELLAASEPDDDVEAQIETLQREAPAAITESHDRITHMPPSRHAETARQKTLERPASALQMHAKLRPALALKLLQ